MQLSIHFSNTTISIKIKYGNLMEMLSLYALNSQWLWITFSYFCLLYWLLLHHPSINCFAGNANGKFPQIVKMCLYHLISPLYPHFKKRYLQFTLFWRACVSYMFQTWPFCQVAFNCQAKVILNIWEISLETTFKYVSRNNINKTYSIIFLS